MLDLGKCSRSPTSRSHSADLSISARMYLSDVLCVLHICVLPPSSDLICDACQVCANSMIYRLDTESSPNTLSCDYIHADFQVLQL